MPNTCSLLKFLASKISETIKSLELVVVYPNKIDYWFFCMVHTILRGLAVFILRPGHYKICCSPKSPHFLFYCSFYEHWLMKFFLLSHDDVVLMQEMLSSTHAIAATLTSSSKKVCQNTGHAKQLKYCSVKLLSSLVQGSGFMTSNYLWSNSCWIPNMGHEWQNCMYQMPVKAWLPWDNAWVTLEMACHKALKQCHWLNGVRDFRSTWVKQKAILNACCNMWAQLGNN